MYYYMNKDKKFWKDKLTNLLKKKKKKRDNYFKLTSPKY